MLLTSILTITEQVCKSDAHVHQDHTQQSQDKTIRSMYALSLLSILMSNVILHPNPHGHLTEGGGGDRMTGFATA